MLSERGDFPPTRFKSRASRGFTAVTDELLPGRKENFVLKCTNPEQGGRKKNNKKTAQSPEQSPLTSTKEKRLTPLAWLRSIQQTEVVTHQPNSSEKVLDAQR